VKLFFCLPHNDGRLLTHLLDHYSELGFTQFHITPASGLVEEIMDVACGYYDVKLYPELDAAASVRALYPAVTEMRRRAQGKREWVGLIDADEFIELSEPLGSLVQRATAYGSNVIRGVMIDRLADDGRPRRVDGASRLSRLFPAQANIVRGLQRANDVKCILVRGQIERGGGAHHFFHLEDAFPHFQTIWHYRWWDGILEHLQAMVDAHPDLYWIDCYRRILDHYAVNGRIAWEQFAVEGDPIEPGPRPFPACP
jgi:hypothetical protein